MAVARVIYLRSTNPRLSVRAIMGETGPKITGGYGGWEVIQRNKRVAMTEWRGGEPFRMAVPLLLNGWEEPDPVTDDEHTSIEDDRAAIERMARLDGGNQRPPIVHVSIPGDVPRSSDVDWVIESIDWGEDLRRRSDGLRVRQWLTVNLLQYVEADNIKITPARRRRRRQVTIRRQGSNTYTVKAGDTLGSIAAKQLGDSSRWREIARLNNIRDPSSIKRGQTLKLPPREDILRPA